MGEDATKSRKAKVTDEHREEAARLFDIWVREKPRLAAAGLGSQEAFGLHYDIGNQAAVTNFLNAKSATIANTSPPCAGFFTPGSPGRRH